MSIKERALPQPPVKDVEVEANLQVVDKPAKSGVVRIAGKNSAEVPSMRELKKDRKTYKSLWELLKNIGIGARRIGPRGRISYEEFFNDPKCEVSVYCSDDHYYYVAAEEEQLKIFVKNRRGRFSV